MSEIGPSISSRRILLNFNRSSSLQEAPMDHINEKRKMPCVGEMKRQSVLKNDFNLSLKLESD